MSVGGGGPASLVQGGSNVSTTRFLNETLATEKPIFGRRQVQHLPPHPVTHLVAANNRIVMVLANKSIQRVDKSSPDATPETVDLGKTIGTKCKAHQAFFDPTGNHLAISLKPTSEDSLPDLVYLSRRGTKGKMSSKIRGHLVTAIGWNPSNKSHSMSGTILVGTALGLVFETEFDSGEDRMFTTNLERYWKQVLDVGKGRHVPITGIQYHFKNGRHVALVSTANRIYEFAANINDPDDKPCLASLFKNETEPFYEASSSLKYSLLSCSYKTKTMGKLTAALPLEPTKFSWLTEEGVLVGDLDTNNQKFHVIKDETMMEAPDSSGKYPLSMVMTEFHVVYAFTNKVVGISLLNEALVFEDELDMSSGQIRGITRDAVSGLLYVYSDYAIYQYTVEREERNAWRVYLQRRNFELATKFAKDSEEKLEEVMTAQADDFYEKGQFVESAICYAKTGSSFETVSLKFLQMEDKMALTTYLKRRLEVIKPSETAQLTMLVIWLFEVYLNLMGGKATTYSFDDDHEVVEEALTSQTSNEMFSMMKFPKVKECVANNKTTFYELLASHGDKRNMINLGHLLQDYDRVIRLHLQDGEFISILRVCEQQRRPDLFYNYGPLLMPEIPTRFISSVIQQGSRLKPSRMIPSLVVSSSSDQELEAVRYLEFCVNTLNSKEPVIHNFLFSLYVKHVPEKVLMFLESRCNDPSTMHCDVNYALRLCSEAEIKKGCVLLHCMLGQLDQAVELALSDGDLVQARFCLDFAQEEESAKRIWLRIARYVVQDKNDVKQAMDFLRQCDGLVKIEDILPFFPDFVTIDDFKDAICDSLQDYSKHIQDLKTEMEEAYDAAKEIRGDIEKFKSRHVFVKANDICSICENFLLSRPFHLFICSHRFHTDCLINQVLPHLSSVRRRKVKELQIELASNIADEEPRNEAEEGNKTKLSRKDLARQELDDLIANECIYCGDVMIKMIDKPFIDDDKFDQLLLDWL